MTRSSQRRASRVALVSAILFAALAIGARPATAVENETFGIVPHPEKVDGSPRRTFGIPLESGAVFEDAIRVYNRTNQELEVLIYAADAEAGTDGTISVGFRGSRPKGVGAWIDLAGESLKLPPRGEALMQFRIEVRSTDPAPDLGAIAVEANEPGVAANLAERLHLVVRTTSPNSPTTSVRVRPLLLRSPWIIVAILGLIVALTIVWLGARRGRRPKDSLVPSGHFDESVAEPEVTPAASKPVLRRLGETPSKRAARSRSRAPARQVPEETDEYDGRPMLDDGLTDFDEQDEPEPARAPSKSRGSRAKSTPRKPKQTARKQEGKKTERFIPLDDL